MRDEPCTPTIIVIAAVGDADDPHSVAIEFDTDLSVWQETRLIANFGGNRHLSLGSDAHLLPLALTLSELSTPNNLVRFRCLG
jgi:hypothetical protein